MFCTQEYQFKQNDIVNFTVTNDLGPMTGRIIGKSSNFFPGCGAGWIVEVTSGGVPNSTYPYSTMVVMESYITNHPLDFKGPQVAVH